MADMLLDTIQNHLKIEDINTISLLERVEKKYMLNTITINTHQNWVKIETNKDHKNLIFETKNKDKNTAFLSCIYRLIKEMDKSIPYVDLGYEPLDELDLISKY